MLNKLTISGLVLTLTMSPTIALSQSSSPGKDLAEAIFSSIENNPNGMLDMAEFIKFGQSIFTSVDSNEDSSIEFKEFIAFDFGCN